MMNRKSNRLIFIHFCCPLRVISFFFPIRLHLYCFTLTLPTSMFVNNIQFENFRFYFDLLKFHKEKLRVFAWTGIILRAQHNGFDLAVDVLHFGAQPYVIGIDPPCRVHRSWVNGSTVTGSEKQKQPTWKDRRHVVVIVSQSESHIHVYKSSV